MRVRYTHTRDKIPALLPGVRAEQDTLPQDIIGLMVKTLELANLKPVPTEATEGSRGREIYDQTIANARRNTPLARPSMPDSAKTMGGTSSEGTEMSLLTLVAALVLEP